MKNKKIDLFVRCLACGGILVLMYRSLTDAFLFLGSADVPKGEFPLYVYFVLNCICSIAFGVLIWKPHKLEVLASIAFLYAAVVFLDRRENPIGVCLYIAGIVSLYARGLMNRSKMLRYGIAVSVLVLLQLSRLRFGVEPFVDSVKETVSYLLVFVMIFVLLWNNANRATRRVASNNVLDLSKYPDLKQRDKEWVLLALQETKYDAIARQYGVTIGTVKNRMCVIFKILGVQDRISLLAEYGGYQVLE